MLRVAGYIPEKVYIEKWESLDIWVHLQVFGEADNMLKEFTIED